MNVYKDQDRTKAAQLEDEPAPKILSGFMNRDMTSDRALAVKNKTKRSFILSTIAERTGLRSLPPRPAESELPYSNMACCIVVRVVAGSVERIFAVARLKIMLLDTMSASVISPTCPIPMNGTACWSFSGLASICAIGNLA